LNGSYHTTINQTQSEATTMAEDNIVALKGAIQVNEQELRGHIDEPVRSSVEETLNALLDAEAESQCGAKRYERSAERVDTRAGYYERTLETKAGEVKLKVPKLRKLPFETQIIERYRRREASVEEALVEMYLAGVSVRRVENITEALWGTRVSSSGVSRLNQKIYQHIEAWRNREIIGEFAYVHLDGIILKRSWAGEVRNVSVLVAVGVGVDGYRQILGVAEGEKEDLVGWRGFIAYLKNRGLQGVKLIVADACRGLIEAAAEGFPEAQFQRCVVHFYRNVFSHVPNQKMAEVARMLKAIHAQENRLEAQKKAVEVVARLQEMKLHKAAYLIEQKIGETFTYYSYPSQHWRQLRTNNLIERVMREIRRRTRVVGAFPDGKSALMLVAARFRLSRFTSTWTKRLT